MASLIIIEIPGWRELRLDFLVLDYNGTLAVDGHLLDGVKEKLNTLSRNLTIHIITADTFGSSVQQCHDINCTIHLIDNSLTGEPQKENLIKSLGPSKVAAIGNGTNDGAMLACSALGIAILEDEGMSINCFKNADVMVKNIDDALGLLINPKRLIATLRK